MINYLLDLLLKQIFGQPFLLILYGELEEGQTWEGLQAAAFYKLDNDR